MFHKRLTWACDLIILNACCLMTLQAWTTGMSWAWGLSLLNCLTVIALRQWLMNSLQIPALTSPLNCSLKRAADILVAIVFLLTAFPVIIVIQAFIIKSSKQYRGPLFTSMEVQTGKGKAFRALTFSNSKPGDGFSLGMTPLAIRLLTGTISLSDVPSLSIRQITTEATPVPAAAAVEFSSVETTPNTNPDNNIPEPGNTDTDDDTNNNADPNGRDYDD